MTEEVPSVDLTPALVGLNWQPWAESLIREAKKRGWPEALASLIRRLSVEEPVHDERTSIEVYLRVLADLGRIGWSLSVTTDGEVSGSRPTIHSPRGGKRRQLIAAREEVLADRATADFVRGMESPREYNGGLVSIFSLMRDGPSLVRDFRKNDCSWGAVISPYAQVVTEERCPHSGFRLIDVWRYFRLTWSNPPRSIPARQTRFLVRDAAADFHPIIGIAEISGAAVKVSARDEFIGWDSESALGWLEEMEHEDVTEWIEATLDQAASEIYSRDLPTAPAGGPWSETIARLREIEAKARDEHNADPSGKGLPSEPADMSETQWRDRAELPLYRSKRAGRLAELLESRVALQPLLQAQSAVDARSELGRPEVRTAVARVVRLAKSRTQGTAIADLTVCGAIAPYNHLIAGKLVALMAASPGIRRAYRERYEGRPSIIASSMAGRPIAKKAELVLLTTTSLYGVRPSQYDRIALPAEVVGGKQGASLRYAYLPRKTEGFGTFHFSTTTTSALQRWLRQRTGKSRVNYTYGEGASPTMRLLREGLSALGLNPHVLLVHGLKKSLYVCDMAENSRQYLLGLDQEPRYLTELDGSEFNRRLVVWWADRWARKRSDETSLARIAAESALPPVDHAARVDLPEDPDQIPLFPSDF